MRWKPLRSFRDHRVGKLHRLRVAARRGLSVPPTVWCRASLDGPIAAPGGVRAPLIVRSAALDEDTLETTAAGKYESVVVPRDDPQEFERALRRVADSMDGAGFAFVQPLVTAAMSMTHSGIAFFDGFHYERTEAEGDNHALTAGEARGDVERGDLVRGEPWSDWLQAIARTFRRDLLAAGALDLEYARRGEEYVLLQARPARFTVRHNPILSLANHREILGEHPSPWIVDALVRAGEGAVEEFSRVDPEVGRWHARYAEAHAGRAWLSFSFFFRLMDHWGLPRTFVTEGVGGESASALDGKVRLGRMLRKAPRLVRLQLQNLGVIRRIDRGLAAFDERLDAARTLADWFNATTFGLDLALRTNFAINGALSGITRVRGTLGLRGRARVVTETMTQEYEALHGLPESMREGALRQWIERFGHRGPLESDPMQPRFADLGEVLLADIGSAEPAAPRTQSPTRYARGPLYAIDARRESFRDELMRRWQRLRAGILATGERAVGDGWLEAAEDVFLLDGETVRSPSDWRAAVEGARARRANEALLRLPGTARRDVIRSIEASTTSSESSIGSVLEGIGLGERVVEGRVRRANDLTALLAEESSGAAPRLDRSTILVVPALEPAWGLVFPRVGALVAELGGELSHASILLRETGTPALINCAGAWAQLRDGDAVRVDEMAGTVTYRGGHESTTLA